MGKSSRLRVEGLDERRRSRRARRTRSPTKRRMAGRVTRLKDGVPAVPLFTRDVGTAQLDGRTKCRDVIHLVGADEVVLQGKSSDERRDPARVFGINCHHDGLDVTNSMRPESTPNRVKVGRGLRTDCRAIHSATRCRTSGVCYARR